MFVGIGNPVYDFIQTPQVSTGTRILSGCSTNGCLAVSKLGKPAYLVGCVGSDFHDRFVADLQRFDIQHTVYPTEETGGFSLIYDARGDRTLDVLGVAPPVPDFPPVVADAAFVLVGPILGETPVSLVERLRDATPAPILLDPQGCLRRILDDGRIERYRNPDIDRIIPLCDVVKANEHEARIITGIDPTANAEAAQAAAERLYHLGCKIAIVTLAAEGSVIYDGRDTIRIPAYATNAVDPTGAGDTYAGGFMACYSEQNADLREVGFFASCVASVMVENTGPDFPLTRDEADHRTQKLLAAYQS
ncbi:MAG: ribokinase [Chloroflexi bacterium]|nr:ribokinase [Chloroflexota bacterium]